MSEPTALAASPPQPGSRGESPGWRVRHEPGGVGEDASEGHRMEVSGLRGKEGVVLFAQGERGGAKPNPSLAPSPPLPLPGYFLESCISVATLGADTSGGLSADAGARKRVFPAWPRAAEEPMVALPPPPACGSPDLFSPAPHGACSAPKKGRVSASGSHSITSEKPPPPS